MDDMAQSLQPKERVCSTGYMELSCRLCTKLSYRNATEMINLFQHRDAGETIKLRTLSDSVERVGEQISARLEEMTQKVLKMYGFDSETGRPMRCCGWNSACAPGLSRACPPTSSPRTTRPGWLC